MQFEILAEFCAIAETRNFSEVANELFVTEAALSRHIKKLENEIGGPLFFRTTRRVQLTPLGTVLLPYAKQAIDLKTKMDAALQEQLNIEKTQLTVAAINVVNSYLDVPRLITKFNAEHPNIIIDLITLNHSPIKDLIVSNICEMAFSPELPEYEGGSVGHLPIRQDRIIALIHKDNPLATKPTLSVSDLKDEKLILISNGSPLFNLCIQICQANGFQPKVVLTMANGDNIRSVVEEGMGIGLLLEHPSQHIHQDFPTGDKIVFRDFNPPVSVSFNLIYKMDLSRTGKIFLDYVRTALQTNEFTV